MKEKLFELIESSKDEMVKNRRHIHANPELSFEEVDTAKFIEDFYKGKDCKVETNVGEGNGIVVTIEGAKPGKTIALRADFDALPITEETEVDYASKNPGKMHACGHDGHTAYMLTLADSFIKLKDELKGTIKILHQPGEETPPGGAKGMVDAGCLKGVDRVLGVHFWSPAKLGTIYCTPGDIMSARSTFRVTIKGKGGHGSAPNLANDSIVAASYFVVALQTIVSRRVDPFGMATVTIGNFDGRGSFNVIKDKVTLEGDVRSMGEETKLLVEKEFKNILDGLSKMYSVDYDFEYIHDYPSIHNDEKFTAQVESSIRNSNIEGVGEILTDVKNPASDDFAYFAKEVPGTYLFVGAMPDDGVFYPHHHPKFNINEKAFAIAAEVVGAAAIDYLENN